MDSFLFALGAVAPIIFMVAIGYFLKTLGFINADLARAMNRLVFRIFLPVTLFLNIYSIENISVSGLGCVIYAICALIVIFFLALPTVCAITKGKKQRGALLQGSFRSNFALIGVPLAQSLFGNEGATVATLMLAATIPFFNALAVICLSVFRDDGERVSIKKILIGILKNPLIQGVAAGAVALGIQSLLASGGINFKLSDIAPLMKVLNYLSSVSTPLALIVLGAQFEFSAVKALKKEIILGTLIRTVAVPFLGIFTAYLFFRDVFGGAHFAALVAMFATPVAVSSVPMAQEMGSDEVLAGQLVIWTTAASAFTIFLVSFILSYVGIFPVT